MARQVSQLRQTPTYLMMAPSSSSSSSSVLSRLDSSFFSSFTLGDLAGLHSYAEGACAKIYEAKYKGQNVIAKVGTPSSSSPPLPLVYHNHHYHYH